jgi:hypothetical protein
MAACGGIQSGVPDGELALASVNPVVYDGWQSGSAAFECAQLPVSYDGAYKVDDAAPNGTWAVGTYGSITISNSDGERFDWSATFPVGAVIVKAGQGANVWFYDPAATSDTGLYAYQNKEVSHVTFCWDYALDVTKTATTRFKRTYHWDIDKTADQSALTLALGQQLLVNYEVTVSVTGSTDSHWGVSGDIVIANHTPFAYTVTDVADVVSPDIAAGVTCPSATPFTLASGASVTCTYDVDLPDGDDRTNTATVSYEKDVADAPALTAVGTAGVLFGSTPTWVYDGCVDVTDDQYGDLGTVCFEDAPKTFEYAMNVGPYATCGMYEFVNVASFVTSTTGATDSASHTIAVDVPCIVGCTLTQGYWKTHSEFGPAPYDDAWLNVGPLGASTPFFSSGKTWYQAFWTAPAGNVYYQLAHQYMAAKLNVLNGAASTPAVDTALASAETFFGANAPTATLTRAQIHQLRNLASLLDQYNNGLIGPGHCSE